LYHGCILDPALSFAYQGIGTNAELVVHEPTLPKEPSVTITTMETKVQSILTEVLKINDAYFQAIEGDGLSSRRLLEERSVADSWGGFQSPDRTVLAPAELGTEPLPMLEPSSSDDEDDSDEPVVAMFESIEAAGDFFAQEPSPEWSW
jgi:hypothetical protein